MIVKFTGLSNGVNDVMVSIKKMEFQQRSTLDAKKQVAVDHYYNDPIQMVKAIADYFKSEVFKQIPPFPQKVVPRYARARMALYKKPPMRIIGEKIELEGSTKEEPLFELNPDNKTYSKHTHQLDSKMREFAEVSWLLRQSLLYSFWNEKRKRLEYKIIPIFQEYFLDSDPINVWGYSYEIGKDAKGNRVWSFFSEQDHFLFNDKGKKFAPAKNPKMINPYKLLPFTKASNTSGAFDVVDAAIQMGIGMTQIALGARFNLGLLWTDGEFDQKSPIKWDTLSVLQVPRDTTLGSVSYGGTLLDNIASIKTFANVTAENNQLRIKWGAETQEISGKALMIMEIENLDSRESDIPIWEENEAERYNVDRTILGVHGVKLSEEYRVDFEEVTFPQTEDEKQKSNDWKIEHNWTTDAQLLIEEDPDRFESVEEAQTFIDTNREANKTQPDSVTEEQRLTDLLSTPV